MPLVTRVSRRADIQLHAGSDEKGAVTGLGLVGQKLNNVVDASQKSQKKLSALDTILQGVGQGAGQAILNGLAGGASAALDAIVDITTYVLDLSGQLADMEAKTGVSGFALQELAYAGDQAAVGLDTITAAIGVMQNNLVTTPEHAVGLSARS